MKKFNFNFFKKLPPHQKKITFSTQLTLLRIALVPFIVSAMIGQWWFTAAILFAIAAITDLLDGYIARAYNQKTALGAALDPLADKLLILATFFTLAFGGSPSFAIPYWFVLLVLCREIIMLCGSLTIFFFQGHIDIAPTKLGKITAAMQMSFICWLFACYFFDWEPIKTYESVLALLILLICTSLIQYLRIGVQELKK